MINNLIELKNINEEFPGVKALSDISFDLRKGEVHAIVGENGAGKSTLIKIITGFHKQTSGSIILEDEEIEFDNPHQAIDKGISCIYQELSIVPDLNIAKNIFLGNWPIKNGLIDEKKLHKEATDILKYLEMDVSSKTLAGDISIAQQQLVEIGRALSRKSKVIIMDEPTSSLTSKEIEVLFKLIRQLKQEGISVIYISHKLEEVMEISDRITVICDGRNITTVDKDDTNREQLIEYMLGRKLEKMFTKSDDIDYGDVVLDVSSLTKKGVFEDINFKVRAGEVLGFFGLVGAGRTEVMRCIFGVDKYDTGRIILNGKETHIHNTNQAVKQGIALIPEDRKKEGLALILSVLENTTIVKLKDLKSFIAINGKERENTARKYSEQIRVKTPSIKQLVGNLSGGNQQKVVIAKWLMMNPKVLILDEPTRGIDVGSKAEIYELVDNLAKNGVAVIVVSSEMNEVMGMSDRIITMANGKIAAEFDAKNVTDKEILSAALGGVS